MLPFESIRKRGITDLLAESEPTAQGIAHVQPDNVEVDGILGTDHKGDGIHFAYQAHGVDGRDSDVRREVIAQPGNRKPILFTS
tara:strand:- start:7950 stop:8201 length:252 start_codon:yes stop_codon:yes gene_type:complete